MIFWYAAFHHWINEITNNNNLSVCQFVSHESSMLPTTIQICLCHWVHDFSAMVFERTCMVASSIKMLSYQRFLMFAQPYAAFTFSEILVFATSPQGHFKRQTTPLDLKQILLINMETMACMGMKEHISWDHGTALDTTWEKTAFEQKWNGKSKQLLWLFLFYLKRSENVWSNIGTGAKHYGGICE